jgi:protein-disulfide isomerase
MQQLVKEYPNDVRWVYRHFPLPQLHQQAPKESEAVECADEQGKGWEMIDKIYEITPSNDGLDLTTLPELARQVGVANIATFTTCLESGKYKNRVDADVADAQSAGGRGTPYSVLITADGQKIPISGAQPYASVKAMVD